MDGKSIAIGVLVVLAIMLGGLVAGGMRQESAHAQGGVYATYLATAVEVRDDFVNFAIIDTDSRRLLIYDMDVAKMELRPVWGRPLAQDFPLRKGP